MAADKRLYRSKDAVFGGVCAGVADYFCIDSVIARIIAVLVAFLSRGALVVAYLALWMVLPREPDPAQPCDVFPQSVESERYGAVEGAGPGAEPAAPPGAGGYGDESAARFAAPLQETPRDGALSGPVLAAVVAGMAVLLAGVFALLALVVRGVAWWQFWPICFVVAGLAVAIVPARHDRGATKAVVGSVLAVAGVALLPMSLGFCSWVTLELSFMRLWPLVVLAIGFFVVGVVRHNSALLVAAGLCFAAFCFMGLGQLWVPGPIDAFSLDAPIGHKRIVVISQGLAVPGFASALAV